MKLQAIAQSYVDSVELEERARMESPDLAEAAGVLRADLHALLIEALRENHISFTDRADAARLAFQITQNRRESPAGV